MTCRMVLYCAINLLLLPLSACSKSQPVAGPGDGQQKVLVADPIEEDTSPPGPQSVPIPKDFKAASFSRDGKHVAFVVGEDKKYRAVIDGRAEALYDNVSIVAFSPSGQHYYYGGLRDKKWQLVRDGKEIAELGGLTSINQGTGLQLIGEGITVTIWTPLVIAFAARAENYMLVCYPSKEGKIFKDGDWLPLSFKSFWHKGMALSPDGKHYCFTVSPPDSRQATFHINGVPGPQGAVDSIVYRQPGNKLLYRLFQNDGWTLMEGNQALAGFPPLPKGSRGSYVASNNGEHVAGLVKREDKEFVVIDGKEGPEFPTIDWAIDDDFTPLRGSFVWSKDGSAHAYAAYDKVISQFTLLGESKEYPSEVVHNGKRVAKHGKVRGTSLTLSDDGQRLAYAANDGEGWTIIVNGQGGAKHLDVGDPEFVGPEGKTVYAAKTDKGWELRGAFESGPFEKIGGLVVSADQKTVAYAAKSSDGKWKVYRNSTPVSEAYDGIVAQSGIRIDRANKIRFVAKAGNELIWVMCAE